MKRIDPDKVAQIKKLLKLDGYRNVVDHIEALEEEIRKLRIKVNELTQKEAGC